MFGLDTAIENFCESVGKGLASGGEMVMQWGMDFWTAASTKVITYCTQNPVSFGGDGSAWGVVVTLYDSFKGIGVGLLTMYFLMGWLRESIDIRNNFSLENMFRFFLRLILTATAIDSLLTIIQEVLALSAGLALEVGAQMPDSVTVSGLFDSIMADQTGGGCVATGFICLIGGLVGGAVIIVCGFTILISVIGRFFKIYLVIPFAPMALASFAGGNGLSQSGISWIKTFLGYCLEIIVIALSLVISFTMFGDTNSFFGSEETAILRICEMIMPMIVAVTCVKGAETTVRKCLGL